VQTSECTFTRNSVSPTQSYRVGIDHLPRKSPCGGLSTEADHGEWVTPEASMTICSPTSEIGHVSGTAGDASIVSRSDCIGRPLRCPSAARKELPVRCRFPGHTLRYPAVAFGWRKSRVPKYGGSMLPIADVLRIEPIRRGGVFRRALMQRANSGWTATSSSAAAARLGRARRAVRKIGDAAG
jgi:hypothetical protein